MDSLRLALDKLNGLRSGEVVSEEEFQVYRKRLLAHHKTLRELHSWSPSSPAPSTSASPCLTPALPPATAISPPEPSPKPCILERRPAFAGRRFFVETRQLSAAPGLLSLPHSAWTPGPSPSSSARGSPFLHSPCSTTSSSTSSSWAVGGTSSPCPTTPATIPLVSEVDRRKTGNGTPCNFAVKLQPLPPAATTADLTQAMSVFGLVVGAVVNKGNPNYGYVQFAEEAGAQAAHAAGSITLCNWKVWLRQSTWRAGAPKSEPQPSCFVGLFNLPFHTTVSELRSLLEKFPGFVDVRMMNRKGGAFAGHAFAQFLSVEEATVCRVSLAGLTLEGQTIDVKFATRPQQTPAGCL
eukprot:RCo053242